MTDDTAQSLIAVRRWFADRHVAITARQAAAEELFRRQNQALYARYLADM